MGYSLIMFKDIIKDLRESQELSQYELAKALQVSQSAIAKWELGKTEPTASALISISKFFKVSTDYLLELEDEFGNKI
jgi:transcriptional regulator with XRE-family HTH domain